MPQSLLTLVNGIPRMVASAAAPAIYDHELTASNTSTGTPVTLPASGSFTGQELEVYLNGQRLEMSTDWAASGAGPTYTAVTFTFPLVLGDLVQFVKLRGP
jgi:hypothetical protein